MSERKPCTRCSRAIDEWSKICPFCNWDQSKPAPAAPPPVPDAVANYTPPSEFDLKKKALYGGIGVLVLIAAFGVGMVINQDGAPDKAPLTVEEQQQADAVQRKAGPVKRADTPLVPTNEVGGIEQPVTSAPVAAQPGATPNDYQRDDATAVSSTEYADIAKRARAEKEKMAALVDPRSLTGPAYAQGPQRRSPVQTAQRTPPPMPGSEAAQPARAPEPRRAASTRPLPQYQPIPRLRATGSARLTLQVGPDGRVGGVNVDRGIGPYTNQLVSAAKTWRFKPATVNGEPVSAPYTVDISFE
ncbi:MAG: periplasmic protein TonB [Acidobacteriota bacterium]|jgi:protein TonB|nr:periplasmic protein TonB [Acidobacteriota bacterium]